MIKTAYTEVKVPCYYRLENGSTIEHCEKCSFYNGVVKNDNGEITGVDCLRNEIGQIGAHVTAFENGDYVYRSRSYDETIDGKLSEEYNYCEKCCFNKILVNGEDICLLRCSVSDYMDNMNPFICYEGEIWEKEKLDDE